jgi:hypothetical protein
LFVSFSTCSKIKTLNFEKFMAAKKVRQLIFPPPLFVGGCWIWEWDPRTEIRDPGWKITILDKHPGSATLDKSDKK